MKIHFKHPHTYQERKAYGAALDSGVKPRAKRAPRNLPENWDDKYPCSQRSWKTKRNHQWNI